MRRSTGLNLFVAGALALPLAAQTAAEALGAAAVDPLRNEPPARIIVDPPLAGPLSFGRVVIQFRPLNLHIVPVFGATALAVSPRVGHVHVTLDDGPWGWAAATGDPVILNGLPAGPHKIRIDLVNANHQILDSGIVRFTVPKAKAVAAESSAPAAESGEPPAKLILSEPLAKLLKRGVVFIPYRTENLHVAPVFGTAALGVSPRVGHIHVTVDGASWHWADASGVPVIVQGLPPGPHKILVQLVNANHKPIDQGIVEVTVPDVSTHAEAR
ncbi:MAG TPA: DUF6130 family protein [Bryobacteraceae bacterium]|nr:DUF6130 family protein [Bryobacteraceae bacterium]